MTDDAPTALDPPMVDPLPEATQRHFDLCRGRRGMVPNVLHAKRFTDRHIRDVASVAAFFNRRNRATSATGMPLNSAYRSRAR
ncbi:hypothetical protein ACRDNQ_17955 [Palleronia sp. KMU-117]|uniref:hypothetical protein n=1 Tax=Palleronia sp. KMU-117 TaxID=3434108 RepID=UPI003D731BB5